MSMRKLLVLGLFAIVAAPAGAIGDLVAFGRIHSECVAAGGVSFGPQGRWPECAVDKARWFSTIDHTDFYQAQYCLGRGGHSCESRALLLFANRAYTPGARMLLGRIDAGSMAYADPQVLKTEQGWILLLKAQPAEGTAEYGYYLWHAERWAAIDAASWRQELKKRLPPGVSVSGSPQPDFDNMQAVAELTGADGRLAGQAEIGLALLKRRLTVTSVRLLGPAGR